MEGTQQNFEETFKNKRRMGYLSTVYKKVDHYLDALCGSFRRAVPFVEHFQNLKKIYFKDTKEKDQMNFSHRTCFCHAGVNFKQCSINVFSLTNKITFKIYDLMEYK